MARSVDRESDVAAIVDTRSEDSFERELQEYYDYAEQATNETALQSKRHVLDDNQQLSSDDAPELPHSTSEESSSLDRKIHQWLDTDRYHTWRAEDPMMPSVITKLPEPSVPNAFTATLPEASPISSEQEFGSALSQMPLTDANVDAFLSGIKVEESLPRQRAALNEVDVGEVGCGTWLPPPVLLESMTRQERRRKRKTENYKALTDQWQCLEVARPSTPVKPAYDAHLSRLRKDGYQHNQRLERVARKALRRETKAQRAKEQFEGTREIQDQDRFLDEPFNQPVFPTSIQYRPSKRQHR